MTQPIFLTFKIERKASFWYRSNQSARSPRAGKKGEGVRTSPETGGGVGDAALNFWTMTETAPQTKIKFYTTGFAGKDINDLKPMLSVFGAVLIDVRFSTTSDAMRWRQIYLKTLLREKYHHLPHLGSRVFREGRAQIQNLDLGIKILLSFNANAVLMCECDNTRECHRLLIAQELWNKGFEAEELKTWKPIDT